MADEAVYISHVQQEVEIETDDDNSLESRYVQTCTCHVRGSV